MASESGVNQGENDALVIAPHVSIPFSELKWKFSRSGGPGGQNVNKVETRVELRFSPLSSRAFDPRQRRMILDHLASRLDAAGDIHVVAGEYRSQLQNREAACHRLQLMLADALRPRIRRIPTRVPHGARLERLEAKKRRSAVKRGRALRDEE